MRTVRAAILLLGFLLACGSHSTNNTGTTGSGGDDPDVSSSQTEGQETSGEQVGEGTDVTLTDDTGRPAVSTGMMSVSTREWAVCERDEDCVVVPAGCCEPCDEPDPFLRRHGVNRDHVSEQRAEVCPGGDPDVEGDCAECAPLAQEPIAVCLEGHCGWGVDPQGIPSR